MPKGDVIFYFISVIINPKISHIHEAHQTKYSIYTEYIDYIKNLNAKFIYLVVKNDSKNYIKDIEPSDAEDKLLKKKQQSYNENTIFNISNIQLSYNEKTKFDLLEFDKLKEIMKINFKANADKILEMQRTISNNNNNILESLVIPKKIKKIQKVFYHYLISLFMVGILMYVNKSYGGKKKSITKRRKNKTKRRKTKSR
jgi:hypothetical protein